MGISQRAYAAHRGVSHQAVNKAVRTGRITTLPDGTIDPARADADWQAQTDPSFQRPQAMQRPQAARKAVPASALDAVRETLHEAGADLIPGETGGSEVSMMRVRLANEILKAQAAKIRLAKMKGDLVDRVKATTLVFDLARRERDAWINWPPRVAALMAADLGVDAHAMEQVLVRHIHQHLSEMAGVTVDLR